MASAAARISTACAGSLRARTAPAISSSTLATRHGRQKSKSYKLGPVSGSVKAGKALTLTVKLPAPAVTALGHGATESASFTATDTNASGTGRATAKVATLKGTK